MSRKLVLIGDGLDELWRGYVCQADSGDVVADLADAGSIKGLPYRNDFCGWCNWFVTRQIDQLHCWGSTDRLRVIMCAAQLSYVEVTVHLVESLNSNYNAKLKWIAKCINRYCCAGEFIAEQLVEWGAEKSRTTVDRLKPEIKHVSAARSREIRNKIGRGGPILLAIERPSDKGTLKEVVWAVAILKHIIGDLKLVVAGVCGDEQRDRLKGWERMFGAENMIHIDSGAHSWDELVSVCDVVLAGAGEMNNIARLLHARAAGKRIVAGKDDCREFLVGYEPGRIVKNAGARHLAGAVLESIEGNLCEDRTA